MTVQDWLGKDNQIGIDIWCKKYQRNDETFEEWVHRVSGGDEDVAELILSKKFLFGGRILSNRGVNDSEEKTTYSNCYVIAPPEDSLESIYDTCKKLARTYSYGGGCGIDISKLAPSGSKIHNQAKSTSGAVSFMDTFSQVTEQIGQNGRRGALMISMDCTHPDLEKFITVKSDLNKVTSANISVKVTDKFMIAVQHDADWELSFTRPETGETITKTVKAKDIFELLCKNNWNYAEPGILFWDRIKHWNLLSTNPDFEYAGVNPCVTGETLINTTEGEIQIKDLVGKTPYVYCMGDDGNITIKKASKVWKTRKNAQIVLVETSRGYIKCTPDHKIYTKNRGWIQASDLKKGDKLAGLNRTMKDETHVSVGLSGGKYIPEHRRVASAYYDICGKDVHHKDGDTLNNTINNLEVLDHGEHSRITNTGRKIDVVRDEKGRYVAKEVKKKKCSFNLGCGVGTNWVVKDVQWLKDYEDVYDMTVPSVHNFVANRIVVHNCAEEPLPSGGSCLLGALNLSAFVNDEGRFDYSDFTKSVRIAVRALNNVLDEGLPKHPLQEQRDSVSKWRQIGLGIMGLADMLIKMGVRYGSEKAIDVCDKIAYRMAYTALDESSKLAAQYGTYEGYDDRVIDSLFFEAHQSDELLASVEAYGLRNSQLLTIAPTGSISTMIGVSGGIEPIFANSYQRLTKSLHGEDVAYKVYTPIVKEYMEKEGITDESRLPNYFVTSSDIPVNERIYMQSVWQSHIDASISSTVNLPHDSTIEDVKQIYMEAWEKGLKGITVYRAGCAREGILTTPEGKDKGKDENALKTHSTPSDGHSKMSSVKGKIGLERHLTTGCGSLHVCAFFDEDGNLKNTYLSKGSSGGCNQFMVGLSRTISLAARNGVSIQDIVDQLKSSGTCPSYAVRRATKNDTSPGSSCPVAIGNALMEMWKEVNEVTEKCDNSHEKSNEKCDETPKCPECGGALTFEGGCNTCHLCGWSKCS